jgi:hypothetical protein
VVKKLLPTAHIEASKSPFKSWEYCGKEDTRVEGPVDFGVPPAALNRAGDKKTQNKMLIAKGASAAVDDGDIHILQLPKLKHAIDLYHSITSKPAELDSLDNYWYYGPPGTGKSSGARRNFPDYFNKPLNKWWCAYTG